MAKINVPLMEAVMAENNPSYIVSLENKFQDLNKQLRAFSDAMDKERNVRNVQIAELTELVGRLEARVSVLEKGPAVEEARERKTGWAITCPVLDNPFVFCGRDGFQPIWKVSDVLEKHGAKWVVWFDTHVDAVVCIKLAQLGDDCRVVQLDRETLEEVEGGE